MKILTFFFSHFSEGLSVNTVQLDVIFQNDKTFWTNSKHIEISNKILRMWCFPEEKRTDERNRGGV